MNEDEQYEFNARYDDKWERYGSWCPRHGRYAGDCFACELEAERAVLPEDIPAVVAVMEEVDDDIPF